MDKNINPARPTNVNNLFNLVDASSTQLEMKIPMESNKNKEPDIQSFLGRPQILGQYCPSSFVA